MLPALSTYLLTIVSIEGYNNGLTASSVLHSGVGIWSQVIILQRVRRRVFIIFFTTQGSRYYTKKRLSDDIRLDSSSIIMRSMSLLQRVCRVISSGILLTWHIAFAYFQRYRRVQINLMPINELVHLFETDSLLHSARNNSITVLHSCLSSNRSHSILFRFFDRYTYHTL